MYFKNFENFFEIIVVKLVKEFAEEKFMEKPHVPNKPISIFIVILKSECYSSSGKKK